MTSAANRRPVRRLAGSAGYTLVEVMVAMLLTCVMVTAVMGVAVTSKQGSTHGLHRMMFDQGLSQLSTELKQYVTACGCFKSTGSCSPGAPYPANACTGISGPNAANGVNAWSLNNAPGTGAGSPISDNWNGTPNSNVWALACGTHKITGLLAGTVPNLEAAPYSGYIQYTVSYPVGGCVAGAPAANDSPTIQFSANWTEP